MTQDNKIYAINVWRDKIGFDGYYLGPYTTKKEVKEQVKLLCEKHNLTFVDVNLFGLCARSSEKTIHGDYMVNVEYIEIDSPILNILLKQVIKYADEHGRPK